MSSKSHKHALTVFSDPKVRAATHTEELVKIVRQQLASIPALENEAAVRAILLGLTLQKLRSAAPHGTWETQLTQMFTSGNIWTPATAKKNASYYMRLASFFVEKTRVTVPEMLALPGDQTELAIDEHSSAQARRFAEKLGKFVGQWSLNELLVRSGIKGVHRDQEDDENTPPEQQQQRIRDQILERTFSSIENLEDGVTKEENLHWFEPDHWKMMQHRVSGIMRRINERVSSPTISV